MEHEKTKVILGIIVIIFLFGGLILELTVGTKFIFAWANTYREFQRKLFFVLYPIFTIAFFFLLRKNAIEWKKFSTRKLYWLLFPLNSACITILALAAPLGWISLSGWLIGSYANDMKAKITSITPYNYSSTRASCRQYADLEFRGNSAKICSAGLIIGETPKQNEHVLIGGQVSGLGIYIQQIRTQSK